MSERSHLAPADGGSTVPAAAYDLVMCDLDGVVYVGGAAVDGVPQALTDVRRLGAHVAFVTNNAARTPATVASHLTELGISAEPHDVVTSAQAVAGLVSEHCEPGATVLALGAEGLWSALRERGLTPVGAKDPSADRAAAVVTGYGPDVVWREVMQTAVAVRAGVPWFASNTDSTIPTAHGVAPGHGAMVRMLADFAGREPVVAGKPQPPLLEETVRRVGGRRPLMVGDRLDTDIDGGRAIGVDTMLVMTGVTGAAGLVSIPSGQRPTYVAASLAGVLEEHRAVRRDGDDHVMGTVRARVVDGEIVTEGAATTTQWWQAVAAAGWAWLDHHGTVAGTARLGPP